MLWDVLEVSEGVFEYLNDEVVCLVEVSCHDVCTGEDGKGEETVKNVTYVVRFVCFGVVVMY